MKRLLILFLSTILLISCTNNINSEQFVKEYGVISNIETYSKYNPTTHVVLPIYKLRIEFKDTTIYTLTNDKYSIGDTILFYYFIKNN